MALVAFELAELRAAERFAAKLAVTLRARDGQSAPVLIDQLSSTGFSAPVIAGHSFEDCISVYLPNLGARTAQIVRLSSGRMGCQFAEALSDPELNTVFGDSTGQADKMTPASPEDFNFPEPVVEPFSLRVRGLLAMGLALVSWSFVFAILRLI